MLPEYLKEHDIPDTHETRLILFAYLKWIGYYVAPRRVQRTLEEPEWPCTMLKRMRDGETIE